MGRTARSARDPAARNEVYGHGTSLRGVDLAEQIAHDPSLQRQRWIDVYRCLWERKAKIDIMDVIVISRGDPRAWYFTSASTGEILRKSESHLNAIAIKRHWVKRCDPNAVTRHLAVLFHEDASGGTRAALLRDLDFNVVLCQPTSTLWTASFLLQPYLSTTRRHPDWPFTLIARFHAAGSTSVHVAATESYFAEMPLPLADLTSTCESEESRRRPPTVPRAIDELVRLEAAALVQHVEAATKQKLRRLQAEFHVTRTHRLVLVRSLQLSQEESAFLEAFGAQAEATLDDRAFLSHKTPKDAPDRLKRLLQRRVFMLRETMWNPASTTFVAKPMAWDDECKRQPQQYEMRLGG
ncbi:hypothetical protein ATCC90586_003030 [Pythium insidiosum]|nr:hypothetical protein ATCC90586_003030 [Pythium insidiosum]